MSPVQVPIPSPFPFYLSPSSSISRTLILGHTTLYGLVVGLMSVEARGYIQLRFMSKGTESVVLERKLVGSG